MTISAALKASFRRSFVYPSIELTQYFPGHMAKGMTDLQRKLKDVDCILEVHDARLPLSGRNSEFDNTIRIRPHILLLNKADLAPARGKERDMIETKLREEQNVQHVMFTNCKDPGDKVVKKYVLDKVFDVIQSSPRFHRENENETNLLVIGVPNVGKSSLINTLRGHHMKKGKATKVGPQAGVTRSVMERIKISTQPDVFMYDSPGILRPNVKNVETGMKLACCATLKDSILGMEFMSDYILYQLNKQEKFRYVDYLGLSEPTDYNLKILLHICKKKQLVRDFRVAGSREVVKRPDLHLAALQFVTAFRKGDFGRINLDRELLIPPVSS